MEEKQILETAIAKYGTEAQLNQAVEEFAELIVAINKIRRKGGIAKNKVLTPFQYKLKCEKITENEFIAYANAYNNLCEEIADVEIMVNQMVLMLDEETIEHYKQSKLQRLEKRVK